MSTDGALFFAYMVSPVMVPLNKFVYLKKFNDMLKAASMLEFQNAVAMVAQDVLTS